MDGEIAERIINLLLYTRKASITEIGAFGLRERFLFCLRRAPQPPRELMEALAMTKSNLALLANKCIADGLVYKTKRNEDRRTLSYSLTENGKAKIDWILESVERKFSKILPEESDMQKAKESLDAAIELLSYL